MSPYSSYSSLLPLSLMVNTIINNRAVTLLREKHPAFVDFLSRHGNLVGAIRAFPDGGLQIAGDLHYKEMVRITSGLWGNTLIGKCFFRSLAPFPRSFYHLTYTADYQAKLGECNFINGQSPAMAGESPGERDLEALLVTVGFRRRLDGDVRRAFTAAVVAWADSVMHRGIFDDGPASLASAGVEYRGTRAQFRIDVSRSGQDMLNLLSLTVLNFGYEIHAIEGIKFAAEEHLDGCFGPARGDPVFLPFERGTRGHSSTPQPTV